MVLLIGLSKLGAGLPIRTDRFHFRLRAWKEGWWKAWTPQVVIGANDPGSHSSNGGGDIDWGAVVAETTIT